MYTWTPCFSEKYRTPGCIYALAYVRYVLMYTWTPCFSENKRTEQFTKITGSTFSDKLLKSRFQNFAADAAKKTLFLGGSQRNTVWCTPSSMFCQEHWCAHTLSLAHTHTHTGPYAYAHTHTHPFLCVCAWLHAHYAELPTDASMCTRTNIHTHTHTHTHSTLSVRVCLTPRTLR